MTNFDIPDSELNPAVFHRRFQGTLPDHLGIKLVETTRDRFTGEINVQPHHMAPNGFLHAGTLVTLADSCAGMATSANLRTGQNFTTVELKSNFFSTVREGGIRAICTPVHRGRTTQVWDAETVSVDTGKRLALFRCTQLVLS
ncbi:MAG: PaaI family thioesterase [Pseudomonadota bacterium]